MLPNITKIPTSPGVYLFKNSQNDILYIGKAKNLKKRVHSYWNRTQDLEEHKRQMVSEITHIETIITTNETEALILESILIKKHQPLHNIILKDDKSHSYIKITHQSEWPTVTIVRRPGTTKNARYFGPYLSSQKIHTALRSLKHIFPFRTKEKGMSRPCLQYFMHRCTEPCLHTKYAESNQSLQKEYHDVIHLIISMLKGGTNTVEPFFIKKMEQASARKEYESATQWRNRIQALKALEPTHQSITQQQKSNQDVISFIRDDEYDQVAVTLLKIRKGNVIEKFQFILTHTRYDSLPDIEASFLSQYYSHAPDAPREIILPYTPTLSQMTFSTMIGTSIAFSIPTKGKKKKLLELAEKNTHEHLKQSLPDWEQNQLSKNRIPALKELKAELALPQLPHRIECYDISNIQGIHPVAAMVVFINGWPAKDQYRKFSIKTVKGANDFAMMKEVLTRRFASHYDLTSKTSPQPSPCKGKGDDDVFPSIKRGLRGVSSSKLSNEKNSWPRPDLVIIDGGKGQLSSAISIWHLLNLDIPVITLAKKQEDIFLPTWQRGRPQSPFTLKKLSTGTTKLHILQHIRDEAHRFAIQYYRKKHTTSLSPSLLDSIPGIGPKRKKKLFRQFGDISGIKNATDDELSPILGKKLTQQLREYL
ncbi:MAG TPA: excinuclease ABC subunit UvrC [Patescibacteria group bacterium]|nr:excinuclease ABC subunit UvrC [Patescibacteria group bacterium]